jgi:drug/metabolite transporter (DMT)-like permease
MEDLERRGLLYAGVAVAAFSTSPVFILWADPLSPVLKTWGRMAVATVTVLVIYTLTRRGKAAAEPASPPTGARSALRFGIYGLVAALHFLFYVAALSFTTAAHALAIVYTAPIFVTFFSAWLLREHIARRKLLGVAIAVAGVAVLAGLEPPMTPSMALGDTLAMLSAVCFGLYSVAGRYERDRTPLLTYTSRVYGAAALWLLPAALFVLPTTPAGAFGWRQLLSVVVLGVVPLGIGHTLYNAALRRVHATLINIIASQEVTGGIILTWLVVGQVPSVTAVIGAAITLVGIALVLR